MNKNGGHYIKFRILFIPVLLLIVLLFFGWVLLSTKVSFWQSSQISLADKKSYFNDLILLNREEDDWRKLPVGTLIRYDGLRQSGQLGEQKRLVWLHHIESLSQQNVELVNLQFSKRNPLISKQFAKLGDVSLKIQQESLQIDAVARHEWHALSWLKRMNDEVFPTGLLQSCSWRLQKESLSTINKLDSRSMNRYIDVSENRAIKPIHFSCKWLLLSIQEI